MVGATGTGLVGQVSLISTPEYRACPPVKTALQEQMQTEESVEVVRPSFSMPSASAKQIQNPFRHTDDSETKLVLRTDSGESQQTGLLLGFKGRNDLVVTACPVHPPQGTIT